jgi:hypothetical protein
LGFFTKIVRGGTCATGTHTSFLQVLPVSHLNPAVEHPRELSFKICSRGSSAKKGSTVLCFFLPVTAE